MAEGIDSDKNMGSPEDVNAEDYNVLYIGHSFGRIFAETLQDYAYTAGFSDHAQYIEISGGESGAPDACGMTMDIREHQGLTLILEKSRRLIMICCSIEFMEKRRSIG